MFTLKLSMKKWIKNFGWLDFGNTRDNCYCLYLLSWETRPNERLACSLSLRTPRLQPFLHTTYSLFGYFCPKSLLCCYVTKVVLFLFSYAAELSILLCMLLLMYLWMSLFNITCIVKTRCIKNFFKNNSTPP